MAANLKQIWQRLDRSSAIRMAQMFIAELRQSHPLTVETLCEGLEDSLQLSAFEELVGRRISSTNMQEFLHEAIGCRSRVVGTFSRTESGVTRIVMFFPQRRLRIAFGHDLILTIRKMQTTEEQGNER